MAFDPTTHDLYHLSLHFSIIIKNIVKIRKIMHFYLNALTVVPTKSDSEVIFFYNY